MKKIIAAMMCITLVFMAMHGFAVNAETVDVVNPKGTILLKDVEVAVDNSGERYVNLGNGFSLYAGADGVLGSYDDLVMGFGSYPLSDPTGNSKDPINWRILDIQDGTATLMSQYCVNAVFYNIEDDGGIDWETSNVRSWLNSTGGISFKGDTEGFYNVAFSNSDKAKILLTEVRMDYSDWPLWDASIDERGYDGAVGTYPAYDKVKTSVYGMDYPWNLLTTTGNNTQDYVYLISGEEVFEYFGEPDYDLLASDVPWNVANYTNAYFTFSVYAYVQGAKYNAGHQPAFFYNVDSWLRSPGIITEDGNCYGSFLGTNGDIDTGRPVNFVHASKDDGHDTTYGVIPLIQVSLKETPDVLSDYAITVDDLEFVANIFKQVNEGNDPHLTGGDWYDIELRLAKAAAVLGSGDAALWVGEIYQAGHVEGIEENEAVETAIEWWQLAIENGQPRGWVNIGLLYAHGSVPGGGRLHGDIELDYAKALEYYLIAYELGDTKAPRYIALIYHNGQGTDVDNAEAAKFFQLAVDEGDSTAFWYLADYYANGLGVEQDYDKAIELYTVVANGEKTSPPGVKQSRHALGQIYEEGLGVEPDLEQAIYWYEFAAEAGYEDSIAALERLKAE